jgi:hypothetical protein
MGHASELTRLAMKSIQSMVVVLDARSNGAGHVANRKHMVLPTNLARVEPKETAPPAPDAVRAWPFRAKGLYALDPDDGHGVARQRS